MLGLTMKTPVSFFFEGSWDSVYYGPEVVDYPEVTIALLGGLAALFAGLALGLFSWSILSDLEPQTVR